MKTVRCNLCIRNCKIREKKRGFCQVRENIGGRLYNTVYGRLSSFGIDYIEKTPLYHFYPNHKFLVLGSVGCNLKCDFCLTWNITQINLGEVKTEELGIEKLVSAAKELNCRGFVYTHSEPTLNLEYYTELMKAAAGEGLKNVLATNGLISLEAFELMSNLDAVALTVKGDIKFYREVCGLNHSAVLKHLSLLADKINKNSIHLEIVHVLIPGFNAENLATATELAKKVNAPLIFLRFFPSYRMDKLNSTPEHLLEEGLNFAYRNGVKYAYVENIFSHPGKNTYCEKCKKMLIKREGYGIVEWNLNGNKCVYCGAEIPIVGEKA